MNLNSISSQSFAGKYSLNANQAMPNQDACLKRDTLLGFWTQNAKNGDKVYKQLSDFYMNGYNKNPNAPLNIVLDIPDSEDKNFEASMKAVGQNFSSYKVK